MYCIPVCTQSVICLSYTLFWQIIYIKWRNVIYILQLSSSFYWDWLFMTSSVKCAKLRLCKVQSYMITPGLCDNKTIFFELPLLLIIQFSSLLWNEHSEGFLLKSLLYWKQEHVSVASHPCFIWNGCHRFVISHPRDIKIVSVFTALLPRNAQSEKIALFVHSHLH